MPMMLFFIPAKIELHAPQGVRLSVGLRSWGECRGRALCVRRVHCCAVAPDRVEARRRLRFLHRALDLHLVRLARLDVGHLPMWGGRGRRLAWGRDARHAARSGARYNGARWRALCRACETHVRIHLPSTRTSHVPHWPFLHWYLMYWPDCAATCQVTADGVSARWAQRRPANGTHRTQFLARERHRLDRLVAMEKLDRDRASEAAAQVGRTALIGERLTRARRCETSRRSQAVVLGKWKLGAPPLSPTCGSSLETGRASSS